MDTRFAAPPRLADDAWGAAPPSAREVAIYLTAELAAAGLTDVIVTTSRGLAVLSITRDFAVWTNGARLWWREGSRLVFHTVAPRWELRRLVFGAYHDRRRSAGEGPNAAPRSPEEVGAAGERLREGLAGYGIAGHDMDVFADSGVAVIYAYGADRRITVTVTSGAYMWPAAVSDPAHPRLRPWHDVARAAAEIAEELRGNLGERTWICPTDHH